MENFFKVCQVEEVGDSRLFVANRHAANIDNLYLPMQIHLQQFVNAFEFLSRKPLNLLYQEVLDQFYIVSKRL